MYDKIRAGKYLYDNNGKLVQAHGGSMLYHDGKFWFYGENKENVTGRATGENCKIWHGGVRLYSSVDLYNWVDEGVILVDKNDRKSPLFPECIMDRPHIIYNEKYSKFVLWAKIAGIPGESGSGFDNGYFAVYVSDKITGGYTLVNKVTKYPAGDFDLVRDNGEAYIIFEKPHTEMLVARLTDDYSDICGEATSHLPYPYPPFVREAPAYFCRGGRKFLLTSGTTGYFPTATETAEIIDFDGEWKELGKTCRGDEENTSFRTQFSSVFRHPLKKDLYIALGDRWLTDLPRDISDVGKIFETAFSGKGEFDYKKLVSYSDDNTSLATYVWLPVKFDGDGTPYIEWLDEWRIEDYD